jgi:hypothetical protein
MATTTPNFGWAVPTSTDLVKDGAVAIETLGDSIDASLVDLKGGTTGQVLAKASNTDMDFTWSAGASVPTSLGFAAGKNKVINGDFTINQRNFTSNTASASFNFDRWTQDNGGTSGTLTITPQTFTPGAAPVAGYEGSTFLQAITASGANTNTYALFIHRIEDVRTLAGQTATISFWAKAASGTPKIALEMLQSFGTGGSPSASATFYAGQVTLSTSWARYSITATVPSISGKTIGTTANTSFLSLQFWVSGGSDFNSRTGSIGLQNNTFQMWGVQAENGSVATAFQTATGTIQGELAACQRYFQRITAIGGNTLFFGTGVANSTTRAFLTYSSPVTLRTTPSVAHSSGSVGNSVISPQAITSISVYNTGSFGQINLDTNVGSGLTASGAFMFALPQNAYLELSAEL